MLTADQVAQHCTRESCWVIVEGEVYDVTDFLDEHPGGPSIILRYAGKDATEEYLPVHPPGTIQESLPVGTYKHLGRLDPDTNAHRVVVPTGTPKSSSKSEPGPPPLELCLCLNDFEVAAKTVLSQRAWTYYSSAAEDEHSHRLNREDWALVSFRPRVLRNVSKVSLQRRIIGYMSDLPIFIAPAALGRLGHPDGELCLARGAAEHNVPYAISTASSVDAADLIPCTAPSQGRGCLFFQLYVKRKKSETLALIARARELGFKALMVTVDTAVVGKRESDERYKIREALDAGDTAAAAAISAGPADSSSSDVFRGPFSSTMSWEDLQWISDAWGNPATVCLKGIMTAEDTKLACDLGYSVIYLSNHGGRQLDYAPSALRTLLEIRRFYPEVLENCDILVDCGVRRATDIIKALCLGARAVGLARPFMYAMSAYGTAGVCKAIQILNGELQTSMRLLGVTHLDQLGPHLISTGELELKMMANLQSSGSRRLHL